MPLLRNVFCALWLGWIGTTAIPLASADEALAESTTGKATRPDPMSKAEVERYGMPRAVDIEIIGRDTQGKWACRGAGTIIHESGYILTCEHITVVGESHKVYLADGTSYDFRVLGRAGGSYDTAILKVDPNEDLPYARLGHSKTVKAGEEIMVIGNPDGKRHTVNFGEVEKATCGGGTQIHIGKADIREGDSGGPVFNLRGEQIAHVHVKITTLKLASRHIRVDHTRDAFAKVFMDESRYDYELGIQVDCHAANAKITRVKSGSPAAAAGIQPGDVIVRVNNMEIREGPHFVLALMDQVTAEPMTIVVKRRNKEISASVTPRQRSKS